MELNPVLEPGEEPRENIWYVVSSPYSEKRPSKRSGHMLTESGYLIGGATPAGLVTDCALKFNAVTHDWTVLDCGVGKVDQFEMVENYCGLGKSVEKILTF